MSVHGARLEWMAERAMEALGFTGYLAPDLASWCPLPQIASTASAMHNRLLRDLLIATIAGLTAGPEISIPLAV